MISLTFRIRLHDVLKTMTPRNRSVQVFRVCAAALVGLVAILQGATSALGSHVTVRNNGPSDNRVDIVFLGDGYTQADIDAGIYADQVENVLNTYLFAPLLAAEPFSKYKNLFNVHRIDVVSNESGADFPPEDIFKDTALDASYYYDGTLERLLYIDNDKANAARDAALAHAGFTAEMQLVIVNHSRHGGGGADYAVFAGGNVDAPQTALHELGHSFGGLADEYGAEEGDEGSVYTGAEPTEVNVTKGISGTKWSKWLGYDQPGVGVIGAYEGGFRYDKGIYRPALASKMLNSSQPFNAVSREKMIWEYYDFIDPLDGWTPTTEVLENPGHLQVTKADPLLFKVDWLVDDEPIREPVGERLDVAALRLAPGNHTITVRAYDPTGFDPINGWVRSNQDLLEQFVTWDVVISVPEPTTLSLAVVLLLGITIRPRRRA